MSYDVQIMEISKLPDCRLCRMHGGIFEPAAGAVLKPVFNGHTEEVPLCQGHLDLEGGRQISYKLVLSQVSM